MNRHPIVFLLIALAAPLVFCLAAGAEIVHLRDGSTVQGEVKRHDDGYDVTTPDGKHLHINSDDVESIEIQPKTGYDADQAKLASLRRSVENQSDIRDIMLRYERFIDQNKNLPIAAEAQKDYAIWQDRLSRGLIKLGSKWVTAEEKAAIQEKQVSVADSARQLLKQGRMKEADELLTASLQEDPGNISAMYLRGVLLLKQDQLTAARKCFDAVSAAVPNHGPTLNNIAVILWRDKQYVTAVNFYDQAMAAAPQSRDILNNVAEALAAVPVESQKTLVVQRTTRHFNDLDAAMQQVMLQQGLYRWGATWVDKAQFDQLTVAEKEVNAKADAMKADFDAATARINRIDEDTDDITKRMQKIDKMSYGVDNNGNIFRLPLPPAYFDYDRDVQRLKAEKSDLSRKQDAMVVAFKNVRQSLPVPKFTGAQQPIGPEGTPIPTPVHSVPIIDPSPPVRTPAASQPWVPSPLNGATGVPGLPPPTPVRPPNPIGAPTSAPAGQGVMIP